MLYLDISSFFFMVSNDDNIVSKTLKWHDILVHIGKDTMSKLAREGLLRPFITVNLSVWEPYLSRKAFKKHFGKAPRASYHL